MVGLRVSRPLAFGLPRYPSELLGTMQWVHKLGLRVALLTDSPVSAIAGEADDLLAAPFFPDHRHTRQVPGEAA